MEAASEAKIAGEYVNARDTVKTRITLIEIKYPQLNTLLKLTNSTTYRILTK